MLRRNAACNDPNESCLFAAGSPTDSQQPKLQDVLYSSNHLFVGGAADAGNATPTFCFSVPAISKLTTLRVESLWTAPTETAMHHILAIDEAS